MDLRTGISPEDAAHKTMDEVTVARHRHRVGAVLRCSSRPRLCRACTGRSIVSSRLTIVASTLISAFDSLTLSPALAAVLLQPHTHEPKRTLLFRLGAPVRRFFAGFNWMFEHLSSGYGRLVGRLARISVVMLVVSGGLIYAAYNRLAATPTGLIPQLDRGYLIAVFQLPPGASLARPIA